MTWHKEVLKDILQHLVGYRDLAEGFLALVESTDNEEFVEELYQFIKKQIKEVKDEQKKKQINDQLRKIQQQREKINKTEERDHQEAEQILDDLLSDM